MAEQKVTIRLLMDLPVEKKHGMTKGRVLRAIYRPQVGRGGVRFTVKGDAGEEVGVLKHEAEVIAQE